MSRPFRCVVVFFSLCNLIHRRRLLVSCEEASPLSSSSIFPVSLFALAFQDTVHVTRTTRRYRRKPRVFRANKHRCTPREVINRFNCAFLSIFRENLLLFRLGTAELLPLALQCG